MCWSLTLAWRFVSVKVPARVTAALVPPHVLTQALLPDHAAVHRPLVTCTLVAQSSWGQTAHTQAQSEHSYTYTHTHTEGCGHTRTLSLSCASVLT